MSNTSTRPWDPHLTVATVVADPKTYGADTVQDEQRFLFVEEDIDGQIATNQPAGHVEPHESLFDAAIRETLEETGWQVELTHFIGTYIYRPYVYQANKKQPEESDSTYFRFCFAAKAVNLLSNVELDHGIIRPLWMTLDELNDKDRKLRSPMVKQCIIDYQAGQTYPLTTIKEWIEAFPNG